LSSPLAAPMRLKKLPSACRGFGASTKFKR
jgi:hypothetical protein